MRIFNKETELYLPKGDEIDHEVYTVLKPIYAKWLAKGVKARELQLLVGYTALDLTLNHLLEPKEILQ